jgi:hypothetical protein
VVVETGWWGLLAIAFLLCAHIPHNIMRKAPSIKKPIPHTIPSQTSSQPKKQPSRQRTQNKKRNPNSRKHLLRLPIL